MKRKHDRRVTRRQCDTKDTVAAEIRQAQSPADRVTKIRITLNESVTKRAEEREAGSPNGTYFDPFAAEPCVSEAD